MMKDKTNYEKVREFHKAFGLDLDNKNPNKKLVKLRDELIREEYIEIYKEIIGDNKHDDDSYDIYSPIYHMYNGDFNRQKVAKELADLLYVVYGTAAAFGIDIDTVFNIVHASNMSKLDEDGKPVYREDGKVLKGPNYKEANLGGVV